MELQIYFIDNQHLNSINRFWNNKQKRVGEKGVYSLLPKSDLSRWLKNDEVRRRRARDIQRDLIIQSMLKHVLMELGGEMNRLRKWEASLTQIPFLLAYSGGRSKEDQKCQYQLLRSKGVLRCRRFSRSYIVSSMFVCYIIIREYCIDA